MLQCLLHLDQKTIRTKIFVPLCYESYEIKVAKLRNYRYFMAFVYSTTVFFLLVIIFFHVLISKWKAKAEIIIISISKCVAGCRAREVVVSSWLIKYVDLLSFQLYW